MVLMFAREYAAARFLVSTRVTISSLASTASWTELQSLFLRYRDGDAASTRPLFTAIQGALEGFFRVRLSSREDALDLTQATLLKVHLARDRFDAAQSLKTWVFTIARRCLIDHWRGADDEIEPIADDFDPADSAISLDRRFQLNHDLAKALESLKPIDRMVVYLYGVEEMPMSEVASALGLTESAAKLRAHRSYKLLRPLLGILIGWLFFRKNGR
jgi:RNA polymerase sigma-70 factor (ECF subfamily)